ncbi:MAG: hypothetical protein KUG75_12875 [Pseudomonadales bacterium]|nr:hypothetical protein [Pseudomonadales bacterium]
MQITYILNANLAMYSKLRARRSLFFTLGFALFGITANFTSADVVAPVAPPLCIDSDYCGQGPAIPYNPEPNAEVATGFFIDPVNGSNANKGTSDAESWSDFTNLTKSNIPSGSDVWFKSGTEIAGRLSIVWECSANNRCIVGTYHMRNGLEQRGLPNDKNPGSPDTAQSTWEGFTVQGNYPSGFTKAGRHTPQINIQSAYVTLENLNCWKSSGKCIQVDRYSGGAALIDNVMTHISATASFQSNRDIGGNEIKNSEFSQGAKCWDDQLEGCNTPGQWSSCTAFVTSNDNSFHHNIVRECWGEGIAAFSEAKGLHVYDNKVIWVRSANLYCNGCQDSIWERNMVIGGAHQVAAKTFNRGGDTTGTAMALSYENSSIIAGIAATGNIFRNNFVTGAKKCITFGADTRIEANPEWYISGEFIGNTCVYNDGYWSTAEGPSTQSGALGFHGSIKIINNIFGPNNPDSVFTNCKENSSIANKYVVENYNLYEDDLDDSDCASGANSLTNAKSRLNNINWTNGSAQHVFSIIDFALRSSSDAIDKGPNSLPGLLEGYSKIVRGNPMDIGALEQ